MTVLLMILNARNLQCNAFQKMMAVWLFSHRAAHGVYDILSRMGLSVSYTTMLKMLEKLADSAQATVRMEALLQAFMLAYDNINRKRVVYDPELGDADQMDSGTAAAFILLQDCDPAKALDMAALEQARSTQQRKELSAQVLHRRIDWGHLDNVMAVHTASFLVQHIDSLSHLRDPLNARLRTTLKKHRMPKGRRTKAFPLGTSNHDEGSTNGNKNVIDDLMIRQLGLKKEIIARIITIIGGDQSTVEKIRTLKRFLEECPHGYSSYGWVLPLIQLWHMGWADLERVLATHWGVASDLTDMSTFSFINELIGGKVKNVKRPDFYPAQALVFDTLRAEVLDCWRYAIVCASR